MNMRAAEAMVSSAPKPMKIFPIREVWSQVELSWLLAIAVCTGLVLRGGVQIYFVSLPGWFVTSLLYVLLSKWMQSRAARPVAA